MTGTADPANARTDPDADTRPDARLDIRVD